MTNTPLPKETLPSLSPHGYSHIGIYLYHMFGHLHVPGQAICTTFIVFVSQKVQRYRALPTAHHSASCIFLRSVSVPQAFMSKWVRMQLFTHLFLFVVKHSHLPSVHLPTPESCHPLKLPTSLYLCTTPWHFLDHGLYCVYCNGSMAHKLFDHFFSHHASMAPCQATSSTCSLGEMMSS